jgi:hypothetical protein
MPLPSYAKPPSSSLFGIKPEKTKNCTNFEPLPWTDFYDRREVHEGVRMIWFISRYQFTILEKKGIYLYVFMEQDTLH